MAHRFTLSDRQRLEQTRDYIKAHLHQKIKLEQLCALALMNRHKLHEGFKRYYHAKPLAYLHELRMTKARELLLTTDLSLEEIAEATGYLHSNNFVAAFKKYFGDTPGRVRIAHAQ